MTIDADYDKVTIEGQVVTRPDSISRSQWLAFWEAAKLLDDIDTRHAIVARYWRYA